MSDATASYLFTIAQVARALGCSKQNVHKQLSAIAPDEEVLVAGNTANAWRIDSLPPEIVERLTKRARLLRCVSLAALLLAPSARFELPLSLSEIAPSSIDRAKNL